MTDTKRPRDIKFKVLLGTDETMKTDITFMDDSVFQPGETFLMREVIPIDWERVWEEYYSVIGDEFDEPLLEELVERALRGEL